MAHKQLGEHGSLYVIDKTPSGGNVVDEESVEKALEDAVFGPSRTPFAKKEDQEASSSNDSEESDSDVEEKKKQVQGKLRKERSSGSWRKRKPAWEDEDDLEVT